MSLKASESCGMSGIWYMNITPVPEMVGEIKGRKKVKKTMAEVKEYWVDGSRLTLEKVSGVYQVIGGRPKRVLVSVTQEQFNFLGSGGMMGVATRNGLDTLVGKAYKLLAQIMRKDPGG